ncbi:MAG: hypothetical protein AB7T38_16180 [Nitrospirales bacterium]
MNANNSPAEIGVCVYCGNLATTEDHVPPQNISPKNTLGLIKVPACFNCNNKSSKDDEFFRAVLVNDDRIDRHPEAEEIVATYTRSLQRPQARGLRISTLRNRTRFPLISPAGIIHGEGTALKTDFIRERKVIERVVKGLFYNEFQRPHPNENSMSVYSSRHMGEGRDAMDSVLELISFIKPENKKTIGNEAFSYGYAIADDHPNGTFWVLTFYKAMPIFVWSVPVSPPIE